MLQKTCLAIFFLLPFMASAAVFYTPSGVPISVLETGATYQLVEVPLPSGILYQVWQLIGVHKVVADELSEKDQIKQYIKTWADHRGISRTTVLEIAACESNFNPRALNPKDTDGRPKYGLYQFDRSTFVGEDIWDWKAQVEQATGLMAKGFWRKWPSCFDRRAEYLNKI